MRVKSLAGAIAIAAFLVCAPAHARTATQGSDLSPAADGGFGCETAFMPGQEYPFTYEQRSSGESTCTTTMGATKTIQSSLLVPGPGTVNRVRIKSGPNPAPLQISILRQTFEKGETNPNGIKNLSCCTGVSESPVFTPTPNTITEVPVNLAVGAQPATDGQTGYHDRVAVTGAGPGELPIASVGPHDPVTPAADAMQAFYPKIQPGAFTYYNWDYPNFVVLVQYDWCDSGATGSRARASQGCGASGGGGVGGGGGNVGAVKAPKAPAAVLGKSLKLKKGKVRLRVKCKLAKGKRCKGKVYLRTRAKKPKALASRRMNIKGAKKGWVTLKLSRKARKRVRRKKNKVQAVVAMGPARSTKNLTLKR